jgi:SAM-dependent methyltransferase
MGIFTVLRDPTALRGASLLLATLCAIPAVAQPAPDGRNRQEIVIPDFAARGWILDLGGGCRGTIGRMKPDQVVAIDISPRELKEAPTNFLKIIMDASDLKFLDGTFNTETAFFSLMYMPPDLHGKIFSEAYRVLQPGGRWLIWDAVVPAASPLPGGHDIYLRTKLPSETIEYGYSIARHGRTLDAQYYVNLAKGAGFKVASLEEQTSPRRTFYLELRKP